MQDNVDQANFGIFKRAPSLSIRYVMDLVPRNTISEVCPIPPALFTY